VKLVPEWGFCGPSYLAESPVADCQRAINLYPEFNTKYSKTGISLIGTPGLATFMTLANFPVRALWAGSGAFAGANSLYAIGGSHAHQIGSGGTILRDYGVMPGSAGTGPCFLKENGIQLLVCDPAVQGLYNLNNGATTADHVHQPTAGSIFYATALEYVDGFFVAIAGPASLVGANTNQINVSAPLDGTTWPDLAFALRTGAADQILQLAVVNNKLWIFGQKNIEVWYNAGTSPFPLARIDGMTINQGLLLPYSVCKLDNTVFWVGADDRGYAVVYRANGQQPLRISNHSVENFISTWANTGSANAFAYQERGHTFYVLNFPLAIVGGGQVGATLAYDLATQMWHERYYLNPGSGRFEAARAFCFASIPNFIANTTTNFVGDRSNGKIYTQSIEIANDAGDPIRRIRTSPHVSGSDRWIKYPRIEFEADIGNAQIVLDYSNDGGRNFATGTPTFTLSKSGEKTPGGFDRYFQLELGRSSDRVFRGTITSSADLIRIINSNLYVGGQ
jgi:hypothetical protein